LNLFGSENMKIDGQINERCKSDES